MDTFNTKPDGAIPKNRHRIPNVGDQTPNKVADKSTIKPGGQKAGKKEQGPFAWDMDGRRHFK